jgi:hypothetical protein
MKKYYETVPIIIIIIILGKSTLSPPIRDFELGLCVLWGGGGAVYAVSLNDL